MDETGDGDVHWRHAVVGAGVMKRRKSRRNNSIVRGDVVVGGTMRLSIYLKNENAAGV